MHVMRALVSLVALGFLVLVAATPDGVIIDDDCTPRPSQTHQGRRYITEWSVSDERDTVNATVRPGRGEPADILKFVHTLQVQHFRAPDSLHSSMVSSKDFTDSDDGEARVAVAPLMGGTAAPGEYFKVYALGPDGVSLLVACAKITL